MGCNGIKAIELLLENGVGILNGQSVIVDFNIESFFELNFQLNQRIILHPHDGKTVLKKERGRQIGINKHIVVGIEEMLWKVGYFINKVVQYTRIKGGQNRLWEQGTVINNLNFWMTDIEKRGNLIVGDYKYFTNPR